MSTGQERAKRQALKWADATIGYTVAELSARQHRPELAAMATMPAFQALPKGSPLLPPEVREGVLMLTFGPVSPHYEVHLIGLTHAGRLGGWASAPPLLKDPTATELRAALARHIPTLNTTYTAHIERAMARATRLEIVHIKHRALLAQALTFLSIDRDAAYQALTATHTLANRLSGVSSRGDPRLALASALLTNQPIPADVPEGVASEIVNAAWRVYHRVGMFAGYLDATRLTGVPEHQAWRAGLGQGDPRNPFLRLAAAAISCVSREPDPIRIQLPPDLGGSLLVVHATPQAPWGDFSVAPARATATLAPRRKRTSP